MDKVGWLCMLLLDEFSNERDAVVVLWVVSVSG